MTGRPKKKDGRVVNFYISVDVLDLIEENRGEKSRSQFVEDAVRYYVSHSAENDEKNYNPDANPSAGRGNRARSKVRDLGSRLVGVRGFESLPLHSHALFFAMAQKLLRSFQNN